MASTDNRAVINNGSAERLSGLRAITFQLLTNCNLRCIMCVHPLQPTNLMTLDTVLNLLDQLPCPLKVSYIGGEPCLWLARYPQVLQRTFRDGHDVHITSNALLFHKLPGFIDCFRNQRISARISIDGYGENYERIRKRGNWDQLVANIRAVIKARMEGANEHSVITVNFQLMRRTLPDVARFVEFCAAEGIDVVQLSYTEIYDRMVKLGEITEDESVFHCQEETNNIVEQARKVAKREGISLCTPAPLGQTKLTGVQWTGPLVFSPRPARRGIVPRNVPCPKPWSEVWVNSDGTLMPCCCGPSKGPVVGSVENGLSDMWHGEKLKTVRSKLGQGQFPSDCRCGISLSTVHRQVEEKHFFSRVRDEKRKLELAMAVDS